MNTRALLAAVVACAGVGACTLQGSPGTSDERTGSSSSEFSVGGCNCPQTGTCADVSYSDIPATGSYYITTFGGGADTQGMACGGTADGTWAYVADEARFGCGAKLLVSANGKSCVAQVADCGPNQCVEEAAAFDGCTGHHPIIDASPFITEYLFGISGSGWSEKRSVTVTRVPDSTAIGCPGGPPPPPDLDAGKPPLDAGTHPLDASTHPPDASGGDAGPLGPPPQGSEPAEAGALGPSGDAPVDSSSGCNLGGRRPGSPRRSDTPSLIVLALAGLGAGLRRRRS